MAFWLLGSGALIAQTSPQPAPLPPPPGAAAAWPAPILDRFPALRWIHTGADPLQYLSSVPAECLHPPAGDAALLRMETGRQLFRVPGLLGARAAQRGMSCQTCHPAGQAQSRFHLSDLSGAPGSVDLRSEWFSPLMEDAALRPTPIPDLLDAWRRASAGDFLYGMSPSSYLRAKLALFNASIPADVVIPLGVYLDALSSTACPREQTQALNLDLQLFEITRYISVLQGNVEVASAGMRRLLRAAGDQHLQALHARFDLPGLEALAAAIVQYRDRLRAAVSAPDAVQALRQWHADWQNLIPALRAREQDSLYDRNGLERWLWQARP